MRICPSEHAHARNLTCYFSHGCRCADCGRTADLYRQQRTKRLADPATPPAFIPTQTVAEHVALLLDGGATLAGIAAAAAVNRSLLERVRDSSTWGRRGTRYEAAMRIFALSPDQAPAITDAALLPSRGLRRRVQALQLDGWPLRVIAQAAGVEYDSLRASLHRSQVRYGTVRRIDAIFQHPRKMLADYADTVSERERIRTQRAAQRRGFVPALAWDNIDHDRDPAASSGGESDVDEVAVELASRGHTVSLTKRELMWVRRRQPRYQLRRAA